MEPKSDNTDSAENGKQGREEVKKVHLFSRFICSLNISDGLNAEYKPPGEFTVVLGSDLSILFESGVLFTESKDAYYKDSKCDHISRRKKLYIGDTWTGPSSVFISERIGQLLQHVFLSQIIPIAVGTGGKADRLLSEIMRGLKRDPVRAQQNLEMLQQVMTALDRHMAAMNAAHSIRAASHAEKKENANLMQQYAFESRHAFSKLDFIPNSISEGDVKTGGRPKKQTMEGSYPQCIQRNDSTDDDKHSFIDKLVVLDRDKKRRDSGKASRIDSTKSDDRSESSGHSDETWELLNGKHDSDEQTISPRIQSYADDVDKKEEEHTSSGRSLGCLLLDIDKKALGSQERKDEELKRGLKVKPLDSRDLQVPLALEGISNVDNNPRRPTQDVPTGADLGGKRTHATDDGGFGNLTHQPYRGAVSTMPQHSTQPKQTLPGLADGLTSEADGIRPFGTLLHAGSLQTSNHEDQQDRDRAEATEQKLPEENLDEDAEPELSEKHCNGNNEHKPSEDIPDKTTKPERSEPNENSDENSEPEQSVDAVNMAATNHFTNADENPETSRHDPIRSSAASTQMQDGISGVTDQASEDKNITPEASSPCDTRDYVASEHTDNSSESMASLGEEGKTCDPDGGENASRCDGAAPRDDPTLDIVWCAGRGLPAEEAESTPKASTLIAQPETESEVSDETEDDDLPTDDVATASVDQVLKEAERFETSSATLPLSYTSSNFDGQISPPTTFRFSQPVQVRSPADSETFTISYFECTPVQEDSAPSEIIYMSQFEMDEMEPNTNHPEDQLHDASGEIGRCHYEASAYGDFGSEVPRRHRPQPPLEGAVYCTDSFQSRTDGEDNALRMIPKQREESRRTPDDPRPHEPQHAEASPPIPFSIARQSAAEDPQHLPNHIQLPPIIVHAAGAIPPWATKKPRLDLRQAASYDNASLLVRRATFHQGWPEESHQDLANTALAGFYYTGRGRQVRCWWCGVVIDCLLSGQDPWEAHARLSPSCRYLVEMRREPATQSK
ncbi:hypothetical protein BaRGS_00032386, partial [Batillaria attramentaria]